MSEDELSQEQSIDDIQELLEHCGAATSPRLQRLRRVAASMQSLEWQLVRKTGSSERRKSEDER